MSKFWYTWLIVWYWTVAIFGLILIGFGFEPTDGAAETFIRIIYAPEFENTDPFRFALGVTGALTLLIAYIYYIAIKTGNQHNLGPAYWRSLLIPLLLWFVTDAAVSIATGFKLNIIPNTLLLVGILIPLIASGVMKDKN